MRVRMVVRLCVNSVINWQLAQGVSNVQIQVGMASASPPSRQIIGTDNRRMDKTYTVSKLFMFFLKISFTNKFPTFKKNTAETLFFFALHHHHKITVCFSIISLIMNQILPVNYLL